MWIEEDSKRLVRGGLLGNKCAWCSYIHLVWQERNTRFHGGKASSVNYIVDCIQFVVRNTASYMKHVARDLINGLLQEQWGLLERIFV